MIQVTTSSGLRTLPREGSYWRHRNGNIYQVKEVSNESDRQAEYPVTITYVGPNGKKWSKSAFNWFEKMSPLTAEIDLWLHRHEGKLLSPRLILEFQTLWRGMMQQAGDGDGE